MAQDRPDIRKLEELEQFLLRLEAPLRGVATNLNAILAVIDDLKKSSGIHTQSSLPVSAAKADLVLAALAVNSGKAGRAALVQTLESWYGGRLDWLSDSMRYITKNELIRVEGSNAFEIASYYNTLKRLAHSPARSFLEDKTRQEDVTQFIERLFLEYSREHRAFHVRRDFLRNRSPRFRSASETSRGEVTTNHNEA